MFGLKYEEILEKIKKEKGLTEEEIEEKVKEKLRQLSDLISKEGAIHIIANELGIKIFDDIVKKKLKIDKLLPGMRAVNVVGKVIKLYGIREYKKDYRQGKVANFLIADDTAAIRIVLWDTNHIAEIENNNLKEDSIIKIKNAYVRENNGFKELHLSNQSRLIVNPDDEKIENVKIEVQREGYVKKQLKDLSENDRNIGIFGTIVQIFEPRFYEICSECGSRLKLENEKFICDKHGIVKENHASVLNMFFDDGTDNIRVVAFRDQVQNLLNLNENELLEIREKPEKFDDIKKEMLGKQLVIIGNVKKNLMFNRIELNAQQILEIDPRDVANELVKEIDV